MSRETGFKLWDVEHSLSDGFVAAFDATGVHELLGQKHDVLCHAILMFQIHYRVWLCIRQ